uniref:Uncharacterized protein n=1 Tax=Avena sativa TaxID=4498 RepID=A0ACD5X851_AVESA
MPGTARGAFHVSRPPPLRGRNRGAPVCRRDVASPDGPDAPHPAAEPLAGAGEGYHLSDALAPPTRRGYLKGTQGPRRTLAWHRSPPCVCPALLLARPADTVRDLIPMPATTDRDDGHQRQCRRVGSADVELHAAMALADMAGVDHPLPAQQHHHASAAVPQATTEHEDEELASTRLSLELGNVGIQSSPCSSSSSGAGQHQPLQAASSAAALPGYGPSSRPRSMLTEVKVSPSSSSGKLNLYVCTTRRRLNPPMDRTLLLQAEKEAKRLRRVLANRESARQTILRRQAIRDELARKVADLASQNENMKKEKDMVLEQYMSLKETNKQLKQQAHHLSLSYL